MKECDGSNKPDYKLFEVQVFMDEIQKAQYRPITNEFALSALSKVL